MLCASKAAPKYFSLLSSSIVYNRIDRVFQQQRIAHQTKQTPTWKRCAKQLWHWPQARRRIPNGLTSSGTCSPIHENDRAAYRSWLESTGFRTATDVKTWQAIKANWIAFLSASGGQGIFGFTALAPDRKMVQFSGGSETQQQTRCPTL